MSESIYCSVCPVCSIKRIDGVFYWSAFNTPTTADEVRSKVCKHAKEMGCINSEGVEVKGLGWGEDMESDLLLNGGGLFTDALPEYTEHAAQIMQELRDQGI